MHPMPMNGIAPPYLAFLPLHTCLVSEIFSLSERLDVIICFSFSISSRIDFFRQVFYSRYSVKRDLLVHARLDIFWDILGGSSS